LPGFPMEQIHLEAAPIGADRASYGEAYLGQSRHLEQLTVAAIDRILAADPGAVIVLFSDHGSGAGYTPTHPADTDLDERTANLVAVRTPGLLRPLPDDVTLINVLPPILNAYLGTDFKLSAPDIYTWIGDDEFDIAPASGVPD
ncbi:MAG TPA: hypothetical protein VLA23_06745, partial [Candidatus Limnocylindrales bacterium]|nr:hypothetical protein [Candidatus Limnocylindrales bacterium]